MPYAIANDNRIYAVAPPAQDAYYQTHILPHYLGYILENCKELIMIESFNRSCPLTFEEISFMTSHIVRDVPVEYYTYLTQRLCEFAMQMGILYNPAAAAAEQLLPVSYAKRRNTPRKYRQPSNDAYYNPMPLVDAYSNPMPLVDAYSNPMPPTLMTPYLPLPPSPPPRSIVPEMAAVDANIAEVAEVPEVAEVAEVAEAVSETDSATSATSVKEENEVAEGANDAAAARKSKKKMRKYIRNAYRRVAKEEAAAAAAAAAEKEKEKEEEVADNTLCPTPTYIDRLLASLSCGFCSSRGRKNRSSTV